MKNSLSIFMFYLIIINSTNLHAANIYQVDLPNNPIIDKVTTKTTQDTLYIEYGLNISKNATRKWYINHYNSKKNRSDFHRKYLQKHPHATNDEIEQEFDRYHNKLVNDLTNPDHLEQIVPILSNSMTCDFLNPNTVQISTLLCANQPPYRLKRWCNPQQTIVQQPPREVFDPIAKTFTLAFALQPQNSHSR